MLVTVVFAAVILQYASAMMNPIFGYDYSQDPRNSPQQLPNVTLSFGDMALNAEQYDALKEGNSAIPGDTYRWKNAIIPYIIDCSIENYPDAVSAVNKAMAQWMRKTCIRFVKWTNEKFHLIFFRNTHCWGNVGEVSYSHISVGPGCEFEFVMAHEIGHAIGYYHEHNRKDRDEWVEVLWQNIGQFREAFDIQKTQDSLGVPYDYESIMHYPWNAFTSNGKNTMRPLKPLEGKVPYVAISKDDIRMTQLAYKCSAIEKERSEEAKRNRRRVESNHFDKYVCIDHYRDCEAWAKDGDCIKLKSVREACKRSCGAPECYGGPCIDLHKECPTWKKWGHCKFVDSVQEDCQKSCNPQCQGKTTHAPPKTTHKPVITTKPKTEPTKTKPKPTPKTKRTWPNRNFLGVGRLCFDYDNRCPKWAKDGECDRNPYWMLRWCMISCPKARCDKKVLRPSGSTCNTPLGLHSDGTGVFKIPDSAFSAPTQLAPGGGWHAAPSDARLYFEDDYTRKRIGAWCATSHHPKYLQVDLQRTYTITFIATQGRDKYFERISKYQIQYSDNGQDYKTYQEDGADVDFFGNCDHSTPVLNRFHTKLRARFIRYIPIDWNWPCVRMEFYGCE